MKIISLSAQCRLIGWSVNTRTRLHIKIYTHFNCLCELSTVSVGNSHDEQRQCMHELYKYTMMTNEKGHTNGFKTSDSG